MGAFTDISGWEMSKGERMSRGKCSTYKDNGHEGQEQDGLCLAPGFYRLLVQLCRLVCHLSRLAGHLLRLVGHLFRLACHLLTLFPRQRGFQKIGVFLLEIKEVI
jgi:hypothetical protein